MKAGIYQLRKVLKSYPDWKKWFKSPMCILSERERDSILYFLKHKKHVVLASELGFPLEVIESTYQTAILVLHARKHYNSWEANYHLQQYRENPIQCIDISFSQ